MTRYVILEHDGSGAWRAATTIESYSAEAALRAWAVANLARDETTAVAVPARFWKPKHVLVESTTTIRVEDA